MREKSGGYDFVRWNASTSLVLNMNILPGNKNKILKILFLYYFATETVISAILAEIKAQ